MPRAVFVFSCCLIASLTGACDLAEATEVVDPAFFELVSVRRESDDQHNIAMTARDGVTWYRAEAAIVDLRHVKKAFEAGGDEDQRAIGISLSDSEKRLRPWSRDNLGKPLGVFFEGRLIDASDVQGVLYGHLLILWPDSDEAYARALAGMRCGGDPKRIEQIAKEVLADLQTKRNTPIQTQAPVPQAPSPLTQEFPPASRPDFFEIVSLRGQPDEVHTVEIKDEQGNRWYRQPDALVDLDELGRVPAFMIFDENRRKFGVPLHFTASGFEEIEEVNERLVGQQVGVVIEDELRLVAKLTEKLKPQFMIFGFGSLDKASRFTAGVEAGGDPSKLESFQEDQKRSFLLAKSDIERAFFESFDSEEETLYLGNVSESVESPVQVEVVDVEDLLGCLSLAELRPESDEGFLVEVADPAGKKWFRKRLPLLDHSDFDYDRLMIAGGLEGRYSVLIDLVPGQGEAFSVWCKQHRGSRLGIFIGQRCVRTFELRGRPVGLIELQSFDSHFDAAEFLRLCKMPPK